MHSHGSTLVILNAVLELRAELIATVSTYEDVDGLADAWEVTSSRFPIILATLSSPEFLEANEDALLSLGVTGAETHFRVAQFRSLVRDGDLSGAFRDGASLLRTVSFINELAEPCRAVADFCDGLSSVVRSLSARVHGLPVMR
jgi:hypothetical protein